MNTALKSLGFDERDRVVIIHADDVGMCQATLPAIAELFEFGLVSSAAVMVPCPWFPQTAAWCREHPSIDMGVHLTLNCEWEAYRWAPISTRDPASGMLDDDGYFHGWPPATYQHADPAAVDAEIKAQVRRALDAGIEATHVDAHMGTAHHPKFFGSYIQAALDNRLPGLFFTNPEQRMRQRGIDDANAIAEGVRLTRYLEARGIPLFDHLAMLPLDDPVDQVAVAKKMIDDLQPGLTMLILHPAQDTPELRAIGSDWPSRVANYQALSSPELRDHVKQSGVQVIGYRPLRELVRGKN